MQKKQRLDDDLSRIPHLQSKISDLQDLVLLVGKGDLVIQKLDKTVPEAYMAANYLELSQGSKCVVIDAQEGYVGICLARMNPEAEIFLYDSNLSYRDLEQRNVDINYILNNVSVIDDLALEKLMAGGVDTVVFCPKGFTALTLIEANISFAYQGLKQNGNLVMITHTKTGANRQLDLLKKATNVEPEVIAKGKGGFRVIQIIKSEDSQPFSITEYRQPISFTVFGIDFEVVTEPSLFSRGDLDIGTRFLLETVKPTQFNRLLDLGTGWGAIGLVATTINQKGQAVLVDNDTRAINIASVNAEILGLSDRVKAVATTDLRTLEGNFDLILSNPPFHVDRGKLLNMFKQMKDVMGQKAKAYLVVEDTYLAKMTTVLEEVFGNVTLVAHNQDIHFSILMIKK